jgi:hypothetical protein
MDAGEFRPIATSMQARWWAFPIPGAALDTYVEDLADVPIEQVQAAVDAHAADGADRPPTSGQIRRRVAELELDPPTWDEVRTALVRWRAARPSREVLVEAWTCPHGECDGSGFVEVAGRDRRVSDCRCRAARVAARRGLDVLPPLAAEFVVDGHVAPAELRRMLDEGDTTSESQIRMRWTQFVHRAVESRAYSALPDGIGVARLEAAREEDGERRERHGDLRRFSAAGLLGAGESRAA